MIINILVSMIARSLTRVAMGLFFLLVLAQQASAQVTSFSLAGNVSQGQGTLNLFRPNNNKLNITPEYLEAFRQDCEGQIILAIDVNEAANGSEKADTQGVALERVELSFVVDGQTHIFTEFESTTRSMLRPVNVSTPASYYTLLGTAGTDRVSSDPDSDINGSSFDATIKMPVNIDISNATSATVTIVFLDTDTAQGDPEAFYDYSNGFESVALVSAADAAYLDALAPGHLGAPLVLKSDGSETLSWTYFPSSQSYYLVSYEDLFPNRGDYDFNDLVVAYQVAVGHNANAAASVIQGNGFLIARGAAYQHDWHLRIALPETVTGSATQSVYAYGSETPMAGYPRQSTVLGSIDLPMVESIAEIFSDGGSTYVNTFAEQSIQKGPRFEFSVSLDNPVPMNQIGAAPFDPYLYVHDTAYEVHLLGKAPVLPYSRNELDGHTVFKDENGYPFAMIIPDYWEPPLAAEDIGLAYPDFIDFINSQGSRSSNWYMRPQQGRVKVIDFFNW